MLISLYLFTLLPWAEPAPSAEKVRQPHPFAPSLPALTKEEEAKLDALIDRFMLYDIGQLAGEEGKQAKQAFDKLGPDATFALLRGLNRAAQIEHSCPVLVIAKKLTTFFAATQDRELLQFARENIGAGVKKTRHSATLSDLKLYATLRQNALPRQPIKPVSPPVTTPLKSVADLYAAAQQETDPSKLKAILAELSKRSEPGAGESLAKLVGAYRSGDAEGLATRQEALTVWLSTQPAKSVQEKLKEKDPVWRAAGARTVAAKKLPLVSEVIGLLQDEELTVRLAARSALEQLSGQKLGPTNLNDLQECATASKNWQAWWQAKQK